MTLTVALQMIGGLVLFLYGIDYLGTCLKRISGGKLESILEKLTSNKIKGVLLGALVTALIQSSGATIVMCVGFVSSGIMTLAQSVGVILGANIGTTITAWLLSLSGISSDNVVLSLFKPENFSPIIGLIGLIITMTAKKSKKRDIGSLLVAFAVLLLGMSYMSGAAKPLTTDPSFVGILTLFTNPILGMLAGLLMTAVLQSSSASIGILQAISTGGGLTIGAMIPILMGENIGSAITGVISSFGGTRDAKRCAWIQMYYCLMKSLIFMALFYAANAVMHFTFMNDATNPVMIAVFHSIFNITAVVIMLPFSNILVYLVNKTFPVTEDEKAMAESRHTFDHLDERFLDTPVFALDQCQIVLNRLADHAVDAMNLAMGLIFSYDEKDAAEVSRLEYLSDEYADHLTNYLAHLGSRHLSGSASRRLSIFLRTTNDLERIVDHALNISQAAGKMAEDGSKFSSGALEELSVYTDAVSEILRLSMEAFSNADIQLAKNVDPLEDTIDEIDHQIKERHVLRLENGECSIERGMLLSDICIALERVSDHCSNIAVYMLSAVNTKSLNEHAYGALEREEDGDRFSLLEAGYRSRYALPEMPANKAADTVMSETELEAEKQRITDAMKKAKAEKESAKAKEKEKEKKKKSRKRPKPNPATQKTSPRTRSRNKAVQKTEPVSRGFAFL